MGAFFTNYHVRHDDMPTVRDALVAIQPRGKAFVSPSKNGWVTIYDTESESQNDSVLRRLAMGLARKLSTAVIAFLVHDSDIAMYFLYANGQLIDEFNSSPDYFGKKVSRETKARVRGDTDALLPFCVSGKTREALDAVLHPADGHSAMAEDIVNELAELLGIDPERACVGFNYFQEEGGELFDDAADFEAVGTAGKPPKPQRPRGSKPAEIDVFPQEVAMLCMRWAAARPGIGPLPPGVAESVNKRFEKEAVRLLERAHQPGRPTVAELLQARDAGPAALAELLAERTPDQLNDVAIMAAVQGLAEFLSELLKRGVDPKATGMQGITVLAMTKLHHGEDSPIHRLALEASQGTSRG